MLCPVCFLLILIDFQVFIFSLALEKYKCSFPLIFADIYLFYKTTQIYWNGLVSMKCGSVKPHLRLVFYTKQVGNPFMWYRNMPALVIENWEIHWLVQNRVLTKQGSTYILYNGSQRRLNKTISECPFRSWPTRYVQRNKDLHFTFFQGYLKALYFCLVCALCASIDYGAIESWWPSCKLHNPFLSVKVLVPLVPQL